MGVSDVETAYVWVQLSSAGQSDCKSSAVDGLPLCNGAMSDLGSFVLYERRL